MGRIKETYEPIVRRVASLDTSGGKPRLQVVHSIGDESGFSPHKIHTWFELGTGGKGRRVEIRLSERDKEIGERIFENVTDVSDHDPLLSEEFMQELDALVNDPRALEEKAKKVITVLEGEAATEILRKHAAYSKPEA